MLLDLKSLFSGEVERIPFCFSLDLSETEMNGTYPFVTPISVEGAASDSCACILLQAKASFDYEAPCDRCAAPTRKRYEFRFSHVLAQEVEAFCDRWDASPRQRYLALGGISMFMMCSTASQ